MADDLTHDTFLKLLTLAEPEAIRNPRAYLMVTANHVMIDQFRKRKLEEDALAALAQLAEGQRHNLPNSVWPSVNWSPWRYISSMKSWMKKCSARSSWHALRAIPIAISPLGWG